MSTETFVFDREAFLNKCVADRADQFAAEAAEDAAFAKATANRRNASKSTGPRTPEGKAASCQNRLAHGLCSSALLIRGESQDQFDALHADVIAAYRPATAEERMLTDQLAEAQWRLNRARIVEAKTLDLAAQDTFELLHLNIEREDFDPAHLISGTFVRPENDAVYRNMLRYVAAIERSHQRCLKNLHHAQERRRTLPPPPPVQPEQVPEEVKAATANNPLPEVGFEPKFVPNHPVSAPAFHNRP